MRVLEPTARSRGKALQLLLLLGAAFVTCEGVWALPATVVSAPALTGLGVIVVATAVSFGLPQSRWSTWAMLAVAAGDIVGVAFMRLAYFDDLPSVGMLAVFPVVWLSYAFRRRVIAVAVSGAFFITLLPVLVEGPVPSTPIEIASIITLPALISGLAIAVGEVTRQLAASQARTHEANQNLQSTLRQVRDSERLSLTLFESVEVALVFYDTEQQLVMANTLAEQTAAAAGFDLHQAAYAGPDVRRTDNKTPIAFEDQIIPRALRGDLQNHEMEWIGPVGHQVAIIASAQRVLRSDGSPWGTLVAAYNVTDLARSLRVKDQFIATVSHELRTPLTSIIGYLELLSDQLPTTSDRFIGDALDRIRRGALNLQQRIEELLETANQRRDLDLAPTDIALLAERVALTFATQAKLSGLDLSVATTRPEWATVDPVKIEQAIENLVTNGLKYTRSPGEVRLTVTGTEDHVHVAVSDTGIGMTSDEIDQAFDPFWRADSARDDAVQGIGIGLSLVRDICEAHHSTITLRSEPGHGLTATIRLPRHF